MSAFQNLLGLDSALAGCSAVVVAGDREAVRSQAMPRGQAEVLVPFADEAINEAGIVYDDLDAVVCTYGPGAFTGLRIGLSAAKGFAMALDRPLYGVTTLQALACNFTATEARACSVLLETKRKDFYVQHFDASGHAVSEPQALEVDDIAIPEQSMLIGDGVERFLSLVDAKYEVEAGYALPDMVKVLRAYQEHPNDEAVFALDPQPLYLRGADVSEPKTSPRAIAQ